MLNSIKKKFQKKEEDSEFSKMLRKTQNNLKPLNDIPAPPNVTKPAPFETKEIPKPPIPKPIPAPHAVPPQHVDKPIPKPIPHPRELHPREHDDLPKFRDAPIPSGEKNIPKPPAYFSKMDMVKHDMISGGIGPMSHEEIIRKPIFVEVKDYKKLLREIDNIKKDSAKSKKLGIELNEIKIKKEKRLENWDKQLEKMQKNLMLIDTILFEGE